MPEQRDLRLIGKRPVMQITPAASAAAEPEHELLTDPVTVLPRAGDYHFYDHGNGAFIAKAPKLVLVWFGDDPERGAVEQFASDLFTFGMDDCLRVYGVGKGTYAGSVVVPALSPGTYKLDGVAALVQQHITAGRLPASDGQTLYAAFTQDGVSVDAGGGELNCTAWCGIHDDFNGVTQSVEPSTDCQGCHSPAYDPLQARQAVLFHEYCEFTTDMQPGQGIYDDKSGTEICDPPAWVAVVCGPYVLQPICGPDGTPINPVYTPPQPPAPETVAIRYKPIFDWMRDPSFGWNADQLAAINAWYQDLISHCMFKPGMDRPVAPAAPALR